MSPHLGTAAWALDLASRGRVLHPEPQIRPGPLETTGPPCAHGHVSAISSHTRRGLRKARRSRVNPTEGINWPHGEGRSSRLRHTLPCWPQSATGTLAVLAPPRDPECPRPLPRDPKSPRPLPRDPGRPRPLPGTLAVLGPPQASALCPVSCQRLALPKKRSTEQSRSWGGRTSLPSALCFADRRRPCGRCWTELTSDRDVLA